MKLCLVFIFSACFMRFSIQNRLCFPERREFRQYWPCEHDKSAREILEERQEAIDRLRGYPSKFARTGFYDRLFRELNTPFYYDNTNIPYHPNYGYNANDQPYRYSNWFVANN